MNVKMVSVTKSLIEEKELTPEQLIVYIARVSNPSNQLNSETAAKLLRYLIKNKHWSPFEQVDICFEIKTSRAIAQQILRHWSFSFQEFSQRYSEVTEIESVQLRQQADKNRQSSTVPINPKFFIGSNVDNASNHIKTLINHSLQLYQKLIENGVAKEVARMILPLTTQTTIYMKGNVRDWLAYLNVRLPETVQKEHRDIAVEIANKFTGLFPVITEATENFNNFSGNFM